MGDRMLGEIAPSIIEQLSEEPTKYWRANLSLMDWVISSGTSVFFASERAAWIDREESLRSGIYRSRGPVLECTRDEVNATARRAGSLMVEVWDETGTVVDSWSVE